MRTVSEVSRLAGISVRTLHHYDAIGLLKPTRVTQAGYRLYDDAAMNRLQIILLFRELQFPLQEIKRILSDPSFEPSLAISQQIKLLEMERDRLDALITLAHEIKQGGFNSMKFDAFDRNDIEQYKAEAKARWGSTEAYQEFEHKKRGSNADAAADMMALFADLGTLRHLSPSDSVVQEKISTLQRFITEHYYTCTCEILSSLGQMYTADERFMHNIDRAGGEGTAAFAAKAIEHYCQRKQAL